ncbi:ribonuclease H-like domain-containing protein [Dunaliella salina]|uniref:Ribonuclease H-like domain-containing protein n=1 Tax=Dunaliella salina TaxID=3046 RepID=A0ABQ7G736_DUNSA|nr:ribonuclease H-like domain-containing protein [Dunaliella salina]|eukprot:KAF5830410.1 ribonuclease H-like domain-containing protein [Dunaliella salina]
MMRLMHPFASMPSPFSKCTIVRSTVPTHPSRFIQQDDCMSPCMAAAAGGRGTQAWGSAPRGNAPTSSSSSSSSSQPTAGGNSSNTEACIAEQRFKVFAIDLETTLSSTSLSSNKKIIELAIVPVDVQLEQGPSSFSSLVNPGSFFKRNHISNISYADTAAQPNTQSVLQACVNLIQASLHQSHAIPVLVAHNGVGFDFPILEREAAEAGVALPPFIPLDTYQLCKMSGLQRRLHLDNLRQATLIEHYGVSQTVAHRALEDAQALATCLPRLLQDATGGVTTDFQGLIKAALDIVHPSGAPSQRVTPHTVPAAAVASTYRRQQKQMPAAIPPDTLAAEVAGLSLSGPVRQQKQKRAQPPKKPLIELEASEFMEASAAGQLALQQVSSGTVATYSVTRATPPTGPQPQFTQQASPVAFTLRSCQVLQNINTNFVGYLPKYQQITLYKQGKAPAWAVSLLVPPEAAEVASMLEELAAPILVDSKRYPILAMSTDKQQGPRPYIKLHLRTEVQKHQTGDMEHLSLRTKLMRMDSSGQKSDIELILQARGDDEATNIKSMNHHLCPGRICDVVVEPKAWRSKLGAGVKLHAHTIVFRD